VTLVLLVRHGLTASTGSVLTGRMPGIGLDDRGQGQAAAVGARLAGVPLDAIISSPLQRCLETAAAIGAARSAGLDPATPRSAGLDPATPRSAGLDPATPRSAGLDPATPPNGHQVAITEDDRFAEVAYGDWTGKPLKRLAKEPLWRVVQAHPSAVRFPGPDGESLPGVQERAVAAIRDWNTRLGPKAVYLVCSHGDVIKSIIADSLGLHLDMFQRIQVDPCSVSLIRYTPLRPFVLRMNDTGASLGGVAGSRPAERGVAGSRPAERGVAEAEPAGSEPGWPAAEAAGRSGLGEGDAVIGGGAGG
jgi:probable phosphomutase (TIGR03848 family)